MPAPDIPILVLCTITLPYAQSMVHHQRKGELKRINLMLASQHAKLELCAVWDSCSSGYSDPEEDLQASSVKPPQLGA